MNANIARFFSIALSCCAFFLWTDTVFGATLRVSPDTGVYGVGQTITARVLVTTDGTSVNAAEGTLSFNPNEFEVVGVSRSASIFNLWTAEPSYSNTDGTITFGGGSPQGYTGSSGVVINITLRARVAGTPKLTFAAGSVLAADGLGTNVLRSMQGATYSIQAVVAEPEPEYLPPSNAPRSPSVTSITHPDPTQWYKERTAVLSWDLPNDVTMVRTLLDTNAVSVPSVLYEEPIREKTLEDLPQGISYFHIQFRNADGWGGVTHYRLAVDSEPPSAFEVTQVVEGLGSNSKEGQIFQFVVEDVSPVIRYLVQIDGGEPVEYVDSEGAGYYALSGLQPGHHTLSVQAFDSAENSTIATYAFDILAFEAPVFTEFPDRVTENVIPVFKGQTRPDATLTVTVREVTRGGETETHTIQSDPDGNFIFIPSGRFSRGVYEIIAIAEDVLGSFSEPSAARRVIVEEPGFVRVGGYVISALSVVVPLIALLFLLGFGMWYLWHRLYSWRRYILKETKEAEYRLAVEFDAITSHLADRVNKLKKAKKGKLTPEEETLITEMRSDIDRARDRIFKEITDIDDIVE